MATPEQISLADRVIKKTRWNSIVWGEEEKGLAVTTSLKYLGIQRKTKVLLNKEKDSYNMFFEFYNNDSVGDIFKVTDEDFQGVRRFGIYMLLSNLGR